MGAMERAPLTAIQVKSHWLAIAVTVSPLAGMLKT